MMIFFIQILLIGALAFLFYFASRPQLKVSAKETANFDKGFDQAIYQDQLNELDENLKNGLISKEEGEGARIEIAKRLLKSADAQRDDQSDQKGGIPFQEPTSLSYLKLVPFLLLLSLSLPLYLYLGSPKIPANPMSARLSTPVEKRSTDELIAQIEAKIKQSPEDARGYRFIVPLYIRKGRFNDALNVTALAMQKFGPTDDRLSQIAETLSLKHNARVPDRAFGLLQKINERSPKNARAQFWLALAYDQRGDKQKAIALYQKVKGKDLLALMYFKKDFIAQRLDALQK